jgi:hypothetical protein
LRSTYIMFAELAIRKPYLIPLLFQTLWIFRRNRWYSRFPFVPVPSKGYLKWRMETAYGDLKTEPPLQELERYLKWSADMRRESSKEQVPVAKLPGRTS